MREDRPVTRTKPPEQRRSELLGAARELFIAKGVTKTSMDEITRSAGVSKGLAYVYFRSKDDLIAALQSDFSLQLATELELAIAGQQDWGAKLDACVRASFDFYRELHELHEVIFRHTSVGDGGGYDGYDGTDDDDSDRHGDDRHPPHARLSRTLSALLRDGVSAGAYRVEDPEMTAGLLYIALHAFDPAYLGGGAGGGTDGGTDGGADGGTDGGSGDEGQADIDARLIGAAQTLFRRAAGYIA